MFIVPNNSEVIILQYMLNIKNPENLVMKLYVNDVTPDNQSTESTFIEVTAGYAPINLTPNSWFVVGGLTAQAEYQTVTWKFNHAIGNVFGYFVTRSVGGELMWAERFEKGPFNIKTAGDEIQITPRLALKNKVDYIDE